MRPGQALPPVPVALGTADSVQPMFTGGEYLLQEKGALKDLDYQVELAERVTAPVSQGQSLGTLTVRAGDQVLARVDIVAAGSVERLSFWAVYGRLLGALIGWRAV